MGVVEGIAIIVGAAIVLAILTLAWRWFARWWRQRERKDGPSIH